MNLFIKLFTDVRTGLSSMFEENTVSTYLGALAVILISSLAILIFKIIVSKIITRPFIANHYRIKQKLLLRSTKRLFAFLSIIPFFWAVNVLNMQPQLYRFLEIIFSILFLIAGVRLASALIALGIDFSLRRNQARAAPGTGKALLPIANMILWAIAVTFFLDNLGFKVSTIIAGLGIMGVAVGLAGQAILADFFSYLVILIDKPFQIGEFVTTNGVSGTVERIGLKTTHLRSINNEIIIINNSEMTKGVLQNYNDILQRRVRLVFPLPFGIPPTKIEEISEKMKEIVENQGNCEFGRAVLLDFGPWYMNFELLYTVNCGDLAEALDVQHQINLRTLAYLESQDIGLAAPPPVPGIAPAPANGAPA